MMLWLLALAGCEQVEDIREHFEGSTPREAYEAGLVSAGLAGTALVRDWSDAAQLALAQPVQVDAPFRETGYLATDRPAAVGYRLLVLRGQRVSVAIRLESDTSAKVFVDVYRAPTDPLEAPSHLVSADSGSRALEFEPRREGHYLIRVQPELLRGGRYTLEIQNEPSLAFPVSGGANRNIQSIFGDPRDGGRRDHHGIDIFVPRGTPVLAATEGTVSGVRQTQRGGKVVWLRDERRGYRLYYAHLDSQLVSNGMSVKIGDTLGLVGNTGNARTTPPHLHFGVYVRGEGPLDPIAFVRRVPTRLPALAVNPSLIGTWTRARRDAIRVRTSPAPNATMLAELPRYTAMRVMAGVAGWYRVQLPDGRMGFVAGELIEEADRPLRREVLAEGRPMRPLPSLAAVAIDSVAAGERIEVLGRFGDFLYVQAPTGRAGWLNQD
jgi:murein DD-endopeptidase MepM/ murein hydrolase activator NlpD